MLVLSRRTGEDIVIPQVNVEFRVLGIRGTTVRIGILAPQHIQILRKEMLPVLDDADDVAGASRKLMPVAIDPTSDPKEIHRLRNLLNELSLTIQTALMQHERGQLQDVQATLQQMHSSIQSSAHTAVSGVESKEMGAVRVLLVEDQPRERDLMVQVLQRGGCEVDIASDGVEAVRLAAQKRPDIILMDLNLPGQDGAAAACQIHEIPACRSVPILAITGEGEDDRSSEFTQWIRKPVDLRKILGRVQALTAAGDSRLPVFGSKN
ncbi:MAG: response regulator [Planctomycetaceae bacterium]